MKKYIISLFIAGLSSLIMTSCLEKYLDKAPESGLTDEDVFTKYENTMKFFNYIYGTDSNGENGVWNAASMRISARGNCDLDNITPWSDNGRITWQVVHKTPPLGDGVDAALAFYDRILLTFTKNIRRVNIVLSNVNKLTDGTKTDINDLKGQAHFARAFMHFSIFGFWGGFPYLDKPIGPYDPWDIPRLSKHETLVRIAADLDTAYTYLVAADKLRRDAKPGEVGHLNAPDQDRPSAIAAKGMKSRALLYAASPQNNQKGQADWEAAAVAAWEALKLAQENGYALMDSANYTKNYFGTTVTNEQLWSKYWRDHAYNSSNKILFNGIFANNNSGNGGNCPTQGAVDHFETRWGDPLRTQAERDAATALGHYNEQNPFVDRDPRFYVDIIYNTAPIPGFTTAKIYTYLSGSTTLYSELLNHSFPGITSTGYYLRKLWNGQSVKNQIMTSYSYNMMRLGEIYLNYAEAANEAYGPNTAAPGASLTAVQAINAIRGRWKGLAPVQSKYTASKDVFRPRIKNERTVELCFEGHYYFDLRRWMDAPAVYAAGLQGNIPQQVTTSPVYPTGYKYERFQLPPERQSSWIDPMYFLPFKSTEYYLMKNFDPGQVW
jgi:hypothetical protein